MLRGDISGRATAQIALAAGAVVWSQTIGLQGVLIPNCSLPVLLMLSDHAGILNPPSETRLIEYKARRCHLAN
jgi:hypothetical protein